jgi:hypothetical protein
MNVLANGISQARIWTAAFEVMDADIAFAAV